jgi:hypothetical protein
MVQLIKKPEVKVLTKEGECEINITLDVNINVTQAGEVTTKVSAKQASEGNEEEGGQYLIPDFKPGKKVNFGERVK